LFYGALTKRERIAIKGEGGAMISKTHRLVEVLSEERQAWRELHEAIEAMWWMVGCPILLLFAVVAIALSLQ